MKKIVAVIAVNILVLLFLLFALEAFLWIFAPVAGDHAPLRVSYEQDIPGLNPQIVYERNEFGLRSQTMDAYEKAPDVIRILCVGASTTEQTTQQTADTWCALFQQRLSERFADSGLRFEAASYGRGGRQVLKSARFIEEYIDRIDPDILVTLLGINDMVWNGMPGYTVKTAEAYLREVNGLWDNLYKYSQVRRRYLWIRAKQSIERGESEVNFSGNIARIQADYRKLPYRESVTRDPDPIDEFADGVNWIVRHVTGKGIAVVLMGQPVLWKAVMTEEEEAALWFGVATRDQGRVRASTAWMEREMARYNRVQAELAAAYPNAYFVDLDRLIPKTLDYYFDDCHFTDLGSARVAEEAMPVLLTPVERLIYERQAQAGDDH